MTKGGVKRIYDSVMYQSYLIDLVEEYVKNFEIEGDYYFEDASKEYNLDGPGVAFDHEPLYDGRYFLEVLFEEDEEDEDEETAIVAFECGQTKELKNQLFSEDIY